MDNALSIPGLDEVVGPMPLDHESWSSWRKRVMAHREVVWAACEHNQAERKRQTALCAASRDYFLSVFGFIYEPRADSAKATRAYVPYPRQVELGRTIDWCLTQSGPNADLLVSKARDVGASWYLVGDDLWRWRFLPTYQGRLVSRNENLVDMAGNSDSLFYKLDFIRDRIPQWLLPKGFNERRHRLRLRLINPETGAAIIGESTTSQSGRGGRATTRKYDEGSFIRGFEGIWDAAANSTEHRIVVSTESLEEDDGFYNIENGRNNRIPPCIFGFDWDQVPGHDMNYYNDMQNRLSEDAFQREILRNATAGLGAWVYPEARDKVVGDFPYMPEWDVYVSIDDGFDDDCAIHFIQKDHQNDRYRIIESYTNSHLPIDFYGSILKGLPEDRFARSYSKRDYALMEWVRQFWPETGTPKIKSFYGDHHGTHTDMSTGTSPFNRLAMFYNITVITSTKTAHKDRQDATHVVLEKTDFNDTPDVARTLQAFQEHRRPRRKSTSEATSESRGGVHDWTSHPVSSFEYFAQAAGYLGDAAPLKSRSRRRGDPYGFGFPGVERVTYG
jgi:hypothetical protein